MLTVILCVKLHLVAIPSKISCVCSPSTHPISSTSVSSLDAVNSCFVLKRFNSVASCSVFSRLRHVICFPSQQYLPACNLIVYPSFHCSVCYLCSGCTNLKSHPTWTGKLEIRIWKFGVSIARSLNDVRRFQELIDDALSLLTFLSASLSVNE